VGTRGASVRGQFGGQIWGELLSVLDRVHPGLHAVSYAFAADGVGGHGDAQLVGFARDGADLVWVELRMGGAFALRAAVHPAGCGHFDDPGAPVYLMPCGLERLLGAVDHDAPERVVAARHDNRAAGGHDARSNNIAAFHRA